MCNSLKVDEKGRLKIPHDPSNYAQGAWHRVLRHQPMVPKLVRTYPMRVWNEVHRNACACKHEQPEISCPREVFRPAVTMDKQGRFLIRSLAE